MADDGTHLIGQVIRRIRKEKGISLEELSERSGVAVGMLSQIERDLGNPSLKTLARIRQALDVPLSAFFEDDGATVGDSDPDAHIRRRETRAALPFGTALMTKEMLSPAAGRRLQFMILNIEPGGTSGDPPLSYPAEKGGMVLQGAFELDLNGQVLSLNEGDSFQFDG